MILVQQERLQRLPSEFYKFACGRAIQCHRWKFYKLVRIYEKRFGNWPPADILSALLDKSQSDVPD